MTHKTQHGWSAFDQGWYDALTAAQRFYTACGSDWAGRMLGRFMAPPKIRRLPPHGGTYGKDYRDGYTTAADAVRGRIDAHASLQILCAETALALKCLRDRHDAAGNAVVAEAEAITRTAAGGGPSNPPNQPPQP
jgi:hypothetical protein